MKKMLLTLYNVKMIGEGNLPIHGACVHITMKNGTTKNIVIIGDVIYPMFILYLKNASQ